ncbi:MAG TPA: cupin domain-containing protein [Polyangiaceae bacterium]
MKAHWLERGGEISGETLTKDGIHHERIETDPALYRKPVDRVKADRGYIEEDIIELRPETPNLDAICAKFMDEHFHDDDEVRFVLEGEGIFDIRSKDGDEWMRVKVEKGDLIVVPKDRHHRFLLTESRAIRCVRLFKDTSGWVPHYRADNRG